MPKLKKKGSVVGQVVSLIVGVGIAILVLIFVGTMGGQTYNLAEPGINNLTGSVVNESFKVNDSIRAYTSLKKPIVSGSINLSNATTKGDIALTSLTIDYYKGSFDLLGPVGNNTDYNISYRWGYPDVQTNIKDSIKSGFSALKQTGDYLPLIILAIVISLVLMLVLSYTRVGQGGNQGAL